MTIEQIISLKEHVLAKNPYFDNGLGIAFKDETSKRVVAYDGNSLMDVLPNDTIGNYFYLRYADSLRFNIDTSKKVTDCGAGSLAYNDQLNMVLVCCMKNVEPLALLNNIRNTMAMFKVFNAVPTGATLIRELVVASELSGIEKKDLQATMQRLGDWVIISVNISLISTYIPSNCIVDPCKIC